MMKKQRLIDAEELLLYLHSRMGQFPCDEYGLYLVADIAEYVAKMPTIDPLKHGYVPSVVLEQIRWERDIAMCYLEEAGVSFGEKAELRKLIHGEWVHLGDNTFSFKYECSECGEGQDIQTRFCSGCGAKMDGDSNV